MDRRTAIRTLAGATALPVLSATELAGALEARRTLGCASPDPLFRPVVLNPHQLDLVRSVADVILPPTDTPGASDLGVHEFIDLMLAEWFGAEESEVILAGLADLDRQAEVQHGADFLGASAEERHDLVTGLDEDLAALYQSGADEGALASSFFYWMKRLTITGYFTSEEGAAQTDYRIVPGTFEGCLVPEPAP